MLEEVKDLSAESMLIIELITFVMIVITFISKEIGWRGYLLKNLKNQIQNFYVRAVVVGLIWGIWYIPILYQVSNSTVLKDGLTFSIILTHILCFCAMSILFTWLFEKDNSISPVIIVQAVSCFVCTVDMILLGSYFPMSTSTAVISQIFMAIAYFVVAIGVIWFDKNRGRCLSDS
ncbi:CPBP family intramembrane glutamic endopeptidase [Wolbachia endosymbiont (group E) of Neria commutata]|uniref:CPBP family intramembrane glutamic endopeptidase n=1 Tax=Wolbachia endosymbiont (group E) of Neria commutata TaxID=3066149 RepID=UPI0031332FC0